MALTISPKKTLSILLSASFFLQSSAACFAAESTIISGTSGTTVQAQSDVNSAINKVAAAPIEASTACDTLDLATTTQGEADTKESEAASTASVDSTKQNSTEQDNTTANALGPAETNTQTTSDTTIAALTPALSNSPIPDTAPLATPDGYATQFGNFNLKGPLSLISAASPNQDGVLLTGAASITPEMAPDRLDELTRQILLKEIELQRFNLNYTSNVAVQGRWKSWRYGTLQNINASLGLAGGIYSVAYRGARLNNPLSVQAARQQNANFIPMIGTIIGASAAALEFGINEYHDLVARHKGFSPAKAMKHVQGLKDDIDRLMAERDAITNVAASSPALQGHVEIAKVEGKVLKDIRDQSLQEFSRFHIDARRLIAFQQMQYFFDLAKNTTNALGYEFAYLSLHRHRRVWNGRAGVLFVVCGQLTMYAPILSRAFGKGVAEITKHRIKPIVKDSETAKVATLQQDLAELNRLFKQNRIQPDAIERAAQREGLYGSHEQSFTDEIRAAQKKNAAAKLTATENIGAGLFVGASKTASGILFIIPGFNQNYNAPKGYRAGRVTNDLLFTAGVVGLPATAFNILDTLRIQVKGELARHKAKAAGTLPSQIIAARMKQLDQMEQQLRAK